LKDSIFDDLNYPHTNRDENNLLTVPKITNMMSVSFSNITMQGWGSSIIGVSNPDTVKFSSLSFRNINLNIDNSDKECSLIRSLGGSMTLTDTEFS
jgi:hypothetical protein